MRRASASLLETSIIWVTCSGLSACGAAGGGGSGDTKVDVGDVETWAGDGAQGYDGEGLERRASSFNQPMSMEFASAGDAVVVDWNNHLVRRVLEDGPSVLLIGAPLPGDWPCEEPGNAERCAVPLSGDVAGDGLALNHPLDVAIDAEGSFWLAAWHNHKIQRYDLATGHVTVVAGLQVPGPADVNGGPAAEARLNFPSSIVRQEDGSLLVSDQRNNRVRRITPDGTIWTIAGSAPDTGQAADDIPATAALLALTPTNEAAGADNPPPGGALALDAQGHLYITDSANHCIRRIDPGPNGVIDGTDAGQEIITTVAGACGESGYSGDGGPARDARLTRPFDVAVGPDGALYVADTGNHVVRRVDLGAGTIDTIAGSGTPGFSGDGGPARQARLRDPYGVAFDPGGDLYVVDTGNNRIRRVVR